MTQAVFQLWGRSRTSKKRPFVESPRRDRAGLVNVDAKPKQIALDRLAILRTLHSRLSQPGKLKSKKEVMESFLHDLDSGLLWPDGGPSSIRHAGRATLYGWRRLYEVGGLAALVPRYRTKPSTEKSIYRPLANPIEMRFAGRPRRSGKRDFVLRLKRHWKNPPLESPLRLAIYYSFPIPTPMARRMRLLRHKVSHRGKPNLDCLNAFVVSCLVGVAFKDPGQIVQFHSEKTYDWWPQVRILTKALPG